MASADTSSDPSFVDVAPAAGLDFVCEHWGKWLGLGPRWFNDVFFCGSPALGDYNGDGFTDLYFPNTRYSTQFNGQYLNDLYDPQDALYLNNGDGTFTDATAFVGIHDKGYSMAALPLDFDGDADLDVIVANFHQIPQAFNTINSPSTVVYRNEGDGRFTAQSPTAMGLTTDTLCIAPVACVEDAQWGVALAAADFDHDGCVDLYRGNYAQYRMNSGMPAGLQATLPDTNNLYKSDCDGTFTEVTDASGASKHIGRTFAVNFADFNHDAFADLYVANDENENEVYLNNHDGTFTDFGAASGAADPRGSMCSTAEDFSGDGNLDLYMSHFEDELNGYYTGHGDGTFESHDTLGDLGLSFNYLGWGCPAIDYDNDGDLDLFVANGHMEPPGGNFIHPEDPEDDNGYELPNFLFQNTLRESGTHSWVDMRHRAGPGLLDRFVSSGAMATDFDLDGVEELVVVNNNNVPVSLYKNTAPAANHWLQVELRSAGGNHFGVGAQVAVTAGTLTQTKQNTVGETLGSGSLEPQHFGLGANAGPATVVVTWPSGLVQTETVAVDQPVRIVEGAGVQLDTLAPKVSVGVAGTQGAHGWWTTATLTVSLTATERGLGAQSGVASLRYSLDGAAWQDYTGPFEVTGEGAHRLTMTSSDGAGNLAWYPAEFRIDSVAPTLAITSPEDGKLYIQDRLQGDSPTGETLVVAPVRTPNDIVALADFEVAGLRTTLLAKYGISTPAPPATASGTLASTAGSDGFTTVSVACADATSREDRVEFRLDGVLMASDAAAPFGWRADLRGLPAGEHHIDVTIFDQAGWSTPSGIDVLVLPTAQDGVLNTAMLGPSLPGGN
ncbi:MAG TPA: FG-GAP-like repeat-containing protein [Candidatus Thermoplasmatota archaeon]|nr:FG-GAP-like repeat-containing protein [Candidatus Thermoplasmatota archaeon]